MAEQEIKVYQLTIEEEQANQRLDVVLSNSMDNISRNYIQKLFDMDLISVNGEPCKSKKLKCNAGDVISLRMPEPEVLDIKAEDIPIDIVYEDEDVLVVNKPSGMVVHPAIGNYTGTLVNAIMYHCGDSLSTINGVVRPGIVHRIDKDTSGLLMIAKNDMAHESLSRQLADHSIKRRYYALVYHNFKEDEGTIDEPLGRDPKNRFKRGVTRENSKRAVTHFRVLERFGDYTLIECSLETGRTHQIRVHMAYMKHPLVGDTLYGPKIPAFNVTKGQLLHAKVLGFVHPRSGVYMEFTSELPEEFNRVLNILREGK